MTDRLGRNLLFQDIQKEGKQSKHDKPRKKGRPPTVSLRKVTSKSQVGLPKNWTRATFIVREDLLENFKAVAFANYTDYKTAINHAIKKYTEERLTDLKARKLTLEDALKLYRQKGEG